MMQNCLECDKPMHVLAGDTTVFCERCLPISRRQHKLERLLEVVKDMRANLNVYDLPDGTPVHGWFSVAPCEFGEAVDSALEALDKDVL